MESRAVFGAMCVFLGHLCLSTAAVGQALPDGKGKAEFLDVCTPCHRTELTTRLRKNPEEWKKIVDDMVARGANGSQEDIDNIVLYLSTNFRADNPVPSAPAQSTAPLHPLPAQRN